jgi:hypothetical protein
MIQLASKTTVALLISLMKTQYGKAWWSSSDREGFILAGLHLSSGEIAYYVPEEYEHYFQRIIMTDQPDVLSTSFASDAADRLLEWSEQQ